MFIEQTTKFYNEIKLRMIREFPQWVIYVYTYVCVRNKHFFLLCRHHNNCLLKFDIGKRCNVDDDCSTLILRNFYHFPVY